MNAENLGSCGCEAVVVGSSSGGMKVLETVLKRLSLRYPLPIIAVQHLHSDSEDYLAQNLNQRCRITVKEAREKEEIMPGVVYLAPANYHLLIEADRTFSLDAGERVNYARPSIDVLFESAADVYGSGLIGVILTGANFDGSKGLKRIKEKGGVAIVQDPLTAEADSMPRAALSSADADYVLPPEEIGPILLDLASAHGMVLNAGHNQGDG